MDKFISVLFALSCFSTAAVSNEMMGAGLWFWVIVISGVVVSVSHFIPMFKAAGAGIALLLSFLSIIAVALGLIASTIGGSFRVGNDLALLLFLFFMIAVFGFTLGVMHKKSLKKYT